MAGVGFELKKLFQQQGLLNSAKAYAFSSVTTIGPMALCMLLVSFMQIALMGSDASYAQRELFTATVVYAFIFSVLLTGGITMVLTRFISDRIFDRHYEHLLSSYYGGMVLILPLSGLCGWLFLKGVEAGVGYKWSAYFFFMELAVMWIQSVHLSALKNYRRIVANFALGVGLSCASAWIVLTFTDFDPITAALAMIDIGFFVVILLTTRHFEQFFRYKNSDIYFRFFSYFRKYPSLLLIGTFFYAGVYIHSFIYWLGDGHVEVADSFRISPFFDLPVFYAYLTVVPSLVTFVVSVETSFYDKFKSYYTLILNGGTLREIAYAKKEMQRVLMREVGFIMEVQLLFSVVSLALGIKLLPLIGFTMEQLDAFEILVLGYYVFIIAFVVMLLLLYYDDRKGVLFLSATLVVLNAVFTQWTMKHEFDGLGLFIASFITLIAALARLILFARNIDYYTFCSQPIMIPAKQPFWKRWRKKAAAALFVSSLLLVLTGCMETDSIKTEELPSMAPAVTATDSFTEDRRIYDRDDDFSVRTLYVTVLPDDSDDDADWNWYLMNRLRDRTVEKDLPVIMQEGAGDGSGPQSGLFGYTETISNGKIGLRGNSTRYSAQRSYSIELKDRAGLWNDQRKINLVKSIGDPTRIRNKLSFDIFETMPDMGSLRTQFIHLYVKDLSEGGDRAYEDYGLFTQIEQPNKNYLKNHWLDPNGQLYKAVYFEFFRYADDLKLESDPNYDPALFESHLEIRGREEHAKLLKMLDDVNDVSIPIDEVIERHFDLDNYLTWMAANILMDNMDTNTQNFLLYSPLNSEKFYFLPWDYDGGWTPPRELHTIGEVGAGISNYWGSVLHNRFLRSQENVNLVKDKIEQLYSQYLDKETLTERIARYQEVVKPFLMRAPDRNYLPVKVEQLDDFYRDLSEVPTRGRERFYVDLQRPRPIFLADPVRQGDKYLFRWDASFDLQGDDLTYDLIIARDLAFASIVKEVKGIRVLQSEVSGLSPGKYFWRVVVRDSAGHTQVPFDNYRDDEGDQHYGMKLLEVT